MRGSQPIVTHDKRSATSLPVVNSLILPWIAPCYSRWDTPSFAMKRPLHFLIIAALAAMAGAGLLLWHLGEERSSVQVPAVVDVRHEPSLLTTSASAFGRPEPALPREYDRGSPSRAGEPSAGGADRWPGSLEIFDAFDEWLAGFESAPENGRPAHVAAGIELAKARRSAMAALIEHDPEEALRRAVPRHLYRHFPQEVVEHLETAIDAAGDYLVSVSCSTGSQAVRTQSHGGFSRHVHILGRVFDAYVPPGLSDLPSAYSTRITGVSLDGKMAVATVDPSPPSPQKGSPALSRLTRIATSSPHQLDLARPSHSPRPTAGFASMSLASSEPSEPEASWTTGDKRLLYIRVAFRDRPADPVSLEEATAEMENVATFVRDSSYGKMDLEVALIPETLHLPSDVGMYGAHWYLESEALRLAREYAGTDQGKEQYDPDLFDLYIIAFQGSPYHPVGRATLGGPGIWLSGFFGHPLILHELGHNLGLPHANFWAPDTDDPVGPGSHREYGDLFDSMGHLPGLHAHYNVAFKAALGWIEPTDVIEVRESAKVRLYRHDHPDGSGLRAIHLLPDGDDTYWIGLCRDSFAKGGVSIRWSDPPGEVSPTGSRLIDVTPQSAAGIDDYPVTRDRIFHDRHKRITIEVEQLGGEGAGQYADLNITVETPPKVLAIPQPSYTFSGEEVVLTVAAEGPGSLSYAWFRNGEEVARTTTPELHMPNATRQRSGDYHVEVRNEFGSTATESVQVIVFPPGFLMPGEIDPTFDIGDGFSGSVHALATDQQDRILVGGGFLSFNGEPVTSLVRLRSDGTLDPSFSANLGGSGDFPPRIQAIALQSDEKMLVGGGTFDYVDGLPRQNLARLNNDGSLDESFDARTNMPNLNDRVLSIAVQNDGRVLVAGRFQQFQDAPAGNLVRLLPDGKTDSSFAIGTGADTDGAVSQVRMGEKGRSMVTGSFRSFNSQPRSGLVRLLENGSFDPDWPSHSFPTFSKLFPLERDGYAVAAWSASYHLKPDGTSFRIAEMDSSVRFAHPMSENLVLTGGSFRNANGAPRNRWAVVDLKGALQWHLTTLEGANNTIEVALPYRENVLLAGRFTSFNGRPANRLVRVNGLLHRSLYPNWLVHYEVPVDEDAPLDDPTSPGIPNLLRYAFALDPVKPDRAGLPQIHRLQVNGEERAALSFTRLRYARDLEYQVEASSDLRTWTPLGDDAIVAAEPEGQLLEHITVADGKPLAGHERRFLRVRVILQDAQETSP